MKIRNIRETFSKGTVALTKTGVRILYTNKNGWVTQSIQDNNTLADLSRNCISVIFDCIRGFAIKISFLESVSDRQASLYQPLDTTNYSNVELPGDIINDSEFFDFFIGADLDDKEDFIGRVNDFLEYRENTRELIDEDFRKYQKDWASFRRAVTELSSLIKCEYEEENLEWITIYIPEGKKTILSGRAKYLFTRVIEMSDVIDIECNVDMAITNITFYI